ncbi:MAG: tyrosine-type recombinase/integrase [Verrucomicrobiales bacterium]|nr:tyrosine-type recombinase/integrase [Verrucomicrobiales bacterium]
MARAYLAGSDPNIGTRTWSHVMAEMGKLKQGATLERWGFAVRDPAFNLIRDLVIIETRADHLLKVLDAGTISTNVFLRRMHNFALDMSWLPWPLLPKKRWPALKHQIRRSIKWEEHQALLAREPNEETRHFYDLMWHLGGSQSDVATLKAEDIDWETRVIAYHRQKTGTIARLHFENVIALLLEKLPRKGFLFPRLALMHEKHRCKEFHRRMKGLGFQGLSLHSYRYAWAERAKKCGFPERFAQEALGHSSKAVHRSYARGAQVVIPALESYENRNLVAGNNE